MVRQIQYWEVIRMWQNMLPIEFLVVRKNYLEQSLTSLPDVRTGKRGKYEVYRLKQDFSQRTKARFNL